MYTNAQVENIATMFAVALEGASLDGRFDNLKIVNSEDVSYSKLNYSDGNYIITLSPKMRGERRERLIAEALGHLVLHTCFLLEGPERTNFNIFNQAIKGRVGIEAILFAQAYLKQGGRV